MEVDDLPDDGLHIDETDPTLNEQQDHFSIEGAWQAFFHKKRDEVNLEDIQKFAEGILLDFANEQKSKQIYHENC